MNSSKKTQNECFICNNKVKGTNFIDTEHIKFLKCPECKLIWRIYPLEDSTTYDSEEYFTSFYNKKNLRRIHKSLKQLKLLDKYINKKGSLLEIGCSLGYFLEAASQIGWQTTGIDVSNFAVEQCKLKGLETHYLGAMDISSLNKKFDAIVMRHVFEHISEPVKQLKVLHENLNQCGLLMLNLPDGRYFKGQLFKEKYKFFSVKNVGLQHYYYYNPHNLSKLLEDNGFKVLMKNDLLHRTLGKLTLSKEFTIIAQSS